MVAVLPFSKPKMFSNVLTRDRNDPTDSRILGESCVNVVSCMMVCGDTRKNPTLCQDPQIWACSGLPVMVATTGWIKLRAGLRNGFGMNGIQCPAGPEVRRDDVEIRHVGHESVTCRDQRMFLGVTRRCKTHSIP